jgi:hypothetical protein
MKSGDKWNVWSGARFVPSALILITKELNHHPCDIKYRMAGADGEGDDEED